MIALLAAIVAYMWLRVSPNSLGVDRYSTVSYMLVFRIVGFSALFFATANVPAEMDQRTIVYLLTRPVPRWMLLVGRYLAAVTVVTVIGVVAALAVSTTAFQGHPTSNPLLARDLLAIVLGAFAYTAAFALASVMIPGRAMIVGIIYVIGWEGLVPNMPGTMYYLSIFSHLQAIAQHPLSSNTNQLLSFLASTLGTNTLTESVSIPVLVLVSITMVGGAAWWFTQFEFLPRDAD
ncbi:MAG TPA: ABC transporter permease subunit [Fimbriimonadaceae bacterium]|nr:ABC transporter permease subunit [Fimbriimonadaceae bacterium]